MLVLDILTVNYRQMQSVINLSNQEFPKSQIWKSGSQIANTTTVTVTGPKYLLNFIGKARDLSYSLIVICELF